VKQRRCKDCINLSKYNETAAQARHMHVVLFEKAFPSRAKRKLCEPKCYEAAKRVPSSNPTQWRNGLPTARLSVEA
jgi:hypothetical protein